MSMFGGIDINEASANIKKGTYLLRLAEITDREANVEYDEVPRRYKIFNFEIAEQDNEDAQDFIGDRVSGLFLNYWPDLDAEKMKGMSSKEKQYLRQSLNLYKSLARAFGASEEEIEAGTVNFDEYVDSTVYCDIFINKNGEMQCQTNKFVNADSVEL